MRIRDLYKKCHWQVSGPTFYQLDLLYDKHYGEKHDLVDLIAERIQLLGGVSLAMAADVAETTQIELNYTFDHKGVHFIVVDNVSDPGAIVGESQLNWLKADLKQQKPDARIVVLTHRPLFDLYPDWDWATKDGSAVIDALMPHKNETVFYGHIHQDNHHIPAHIAHHSAKSLMFPLPAPGSVPKKTPIPWDASAPYKGLGLRTIEAEPKQAKYVIKELNVTGA